MLTAGWLIMQLDTHRRHRFDIARRVFPIDADRVEPKRCGEPSDFNRAKPEFQAGQRGDQSCLSIAQCLANAMRLKERRRPIYGHAQVVVLTSTHGDPVCGEELNSGDQFACDIPNLKGKIFISIIAPLG
jgi:hypothetical protein